MTPKEIAFAAVKALDSKKGQDIKMLETGHLTTLADYFVLCSATSSTQIKALADVCEKMLKDAGEPPHMWRDTGAAPGSCWTSPLWWSTFSMRRPGPFTTWSACGVTPPLWTSAKC